MRIIIKAVSLSLLLFTIGAKAQQLPFTSQYMFNDYILNPAVGGSLDYMPVSLSVRSQWAGLEGAPETQIFSAHSKVGKKVGVGGYVFRDELGPINKQGFQLSYSYHLKMNDKANLSLGLGGMLVTHHISTAQLRFDDPTDGAIRNIRQTAVSPDVSFGALYYTDKYKIGISVPQILQNNIYDNLSDEENQNTLIRHYFLHGEYLFKVNDNFDVVPGALVKIVVGAPLQFDVNIKGLYKKNYWLGLSYRHDESIVSMIGLKYKKLQLGYSYDYTLTDINSYSSGSHELYLGLIIGEKKEVGSAKFD